MQKNRIMHHIYARLPTILASVDMSRAFSMASGDMSHPMFAGVVSAESKPRSESDTHTGSLKAARLE